ncbi:MAG: hypothetical protein JWP91_3587 [Fibrobacteres bacterium]|nr:hypothetical protein [Fibrobacterota bacterium]
MMWILGEKEMMEHDRAAMARHFPPGSQSIAIPDSGLGFSAGGFRRSWEAWNFCVFRGKSGTGSLGYGVPKFGYFL